jgi:hypothetical protein
MTKPRAFTVPGFPPVLRPLSLLTVQNQADPGVVATPALAWLRFQSLYYGQYYLCHPLSLKTVFGTGPQTLQGGSSRCASTPSTWEAALPSDTSARVSATVRNSAATSRRCVGSRLCHDGEARRTSTDADLSANIRRTRVSRCTRSLPLSHADWCNSGAGGMARRIVAAKAI